MQADFQPFPTTDVALARLIGTGRHGTVFAGSYATRQVAIKIPSSRATGDHEFRALRHFTHPNIVELLAGPLDNGALVLELCEGGTLADRIAAEPISGSEAASLGHALLDALEYIHTIGWIHGDVAPSNIGLRGNGSPVLLDFGTARLVGGAEISEGTAAYVGPLRQPVPALDLRALAATLVAAVGTETRWEGESCPLRGSLRTFIDRADCERPARARELRTILDSVVSTPPLPSNHPTFSGGGGIGRGSTDAFGPQPEPTSDAMTRRRSRRRPIAAAAVCLTASLLFGVEILSAAPPTRDVREQPQSPSNAAHTLSAHYVTWDSETAVLSREVDGEIVQWHVGSPGDEVAVADWTCDGSATLGVYRPTNGSWFVFTSWDAGAESAQFAQLRANGTLRITTGNGCATPAIVD